MASFELSRLGIPHVLMDKALFPRDKVCGDALSGKVLDALQASRPSVVDELKKLPDLFQPSPGIRFFGPNGKYIDVPCPDRRDGLTAGYVAARQGFDHLLVRHLDAHLCTFYQGAGHLAFGHENQVSFMVGNRHYLAKPQLVIGADGALSATAAHRGLRRVHKGHHSAAVRAYFQGVVGFEKNFIELHFIKELLPGYFWVFPLPNGGANVGLGMLSANIAKHKVNLRALLEKTIAHHPALSQRFAQARLLGPVRGWGLPLGSVKRTISGDGLLLVGDAAGLIDPFTGEGIGNAFQSGQMAAQWAFKALHANDFTGKFLQGYDKQVYQHLWPELKLSHRIQKLSSIPWLFNFLLNKAAGNPNLRNTMTAMFANVDLRAKLKSPWFYLNLVRGK
jgi:geranylgeranyl reductase family protein